MISDNLKYLRKSNGYSQQYLSDSLQIPRTTLGDYERGKTEPNISNLKKMAEFYQLPIDDLVNDHLSIETIEITKSNQLKVLAITVNANNDENIELVDTKAEAGYLDSFQNPEYIRDLPKIQFPKMPQGTFRGFEIQGDSMLPMEPGTVIICQYLEQLNQVKDDKTYIVVSKDQGLVYKRVRNIRDKKELVLVSDNEAFLPYTIPYEEINEIWEYYAHISFSDHKATFNQMLEEKLSNIQAKVNQLHHKLV